MCFNLCKRASIFGCSCKLTSRARSTQAKQVCKTTSNRPNHAVILKCLAQNQRCFQPYCRRAPVSGTGKRMLIFRCSRRFCWLTSTIGVAEVFGWRPKLGTFVEGWSKVKSRTINFIQHALQPSLWKRGVHVLSFGQNIAGPHDTSRHLKHQGDLGKQTSKSRCWSPWISNICICTWKAWGVWWLCLQICPIYTHAKFWKTISGGCNCCFKGTSAVLAFAAVSWSEIGLESSLTQYL